MVLKPALSGFNLSKPSVAGMLGWLGLHTVGSTLVGAEHPFPTVVRSSKRNASMDPDYARPGTVEHKVLREGRRAVRTILEAG